MTNKYYIERINKVIDYIEVNLDSKLLLAELAEVAMFSKYHFHRIFKNVTGENLNEFIKRMRMIKAYRFLQVDKTLEIRDFAIKVDIILRQIFPGTSKNFMASLHHRRDNQIKFWKKG
jgi:AraC family transcriptional regulator